MKKIHQMVVFQPTYILVLLLFLFLFSCSKSRTKAAGEILLSEVIYEENGIYYKLAAPGKKPTYTGPCEFYYSDSRVKGTVNVVNGVPDGEWKYFHENGAKKYTLFFEKGTLIKRVDYEN
jgi:antitoxin component YwqK of YwqJK toxin-antitoxin module